ncbi:MAG: ABC transporter ATP-binding protein [Bradymonadaceae bacterium]
MKSIELRSLSRHYGRNFALHRVSTSFRAGQLTAILGGNGAGKTTMLNILATLDRPSQGEVFYGKRSWKDFARRGRAQIGWVSHDSLLYSELTGRENLLFFARMYGLKAPVELTEKWLENVGMTRAGDQRVDTYSRGMRQRLTVARALLHDPRLILLDEPTTGLDQEGTRQIIDLFSALRDQGRVVILITHDLGMLADRIDRLCILKQGKLTYEGEARSQEEILEAYEQFA